MTKNDPHYDYFAISGGKDWFEMRSEPLSKIKSAVIEMLKSNEITEGVRIEVRRFSTDKVKQKYIVWNKSKTSVNFVKDDPKVVYKTVTGDDILIELKKLYETFDHDVQKVNDNTYQIRIEDKNAKWFKKDLIEDHKLKAKQVTIRKSLFSQWFEQRSDGSYNAGYWHFITISDLTELKVKIS
jgi:tRNA/tmRNA/rRNA uracil-C5-methylase (TrmA/RlmC/RlmD family)